MFQHTSDDEASSGVLDGAMIRGLVQFEYRSMVIRQLQVTVEWQQIEWLDQAACSRSGTATRQTCADCPVRAQCLTLALAVDDPDIWRGGICRSEREELWVRLESLFTDLQDRSFMRLDRLIDGRGSG
jgi:hypothetical protein